MTMRTSGYDIMPLVKRKNAKPGRVAPNKIGVFDHHGNLGGQVGKLATAATVARFGAYGARLVKNSTGKHEWRGGKQK